MAPFPGDSSKHQFGTSMPHGGHPPHHSITSLAISRRRARERSAARLSRARGGDFSVCAMLLLIAAIGTTRMACDEGRQAFTPPRGPFSLNPLVAPVPVGSAARLAAARVLVLLQLLGGQQRVELAQSAVQAVE